MLLLAISAFAEGRAKYVFYFIGDGMGVNQVNGTETYLAALEGEIGVRSLCFTSFPAVGLVTTFSGTNGVTDSAASGTALSTGKKTKNGTLGMLADHETPIYSVAMAAKNGGAAVGVSSSVGICHATPGAFYAHVPNRNQYYQVGKDMIAAGYDYYAGSGFHKPMGEGAAASEGSLYDQCEAAGYVFARGYKDFQKKIKKNDRVILFQPEGANNGDDTCLPYAIDHTKTDLSLADITRAGIAALTKQQKDGFFLMVEGGKIDYACHSNDAATVFKEVIDFNQAIQVAYEFYQQHPDETLIVVTADHETGGIVLGKGPYELHTDVLKYQKMSAERYSQYLEQQYKKLGKKFTWAFVESDLKKNWGFWDGVKLDEKQTEKLKKAFNKLMDGHDESSKSLYASLNGISDTARKILNDIALVGWQSNGHSNGYVPVFAIGNGSETFVGKIDNTSIPKKIAAAAGWEMPQAE